MTVSEDSTETDAPEREVAISSCVYAIVDSKTGRILYIGESGAFLKAKVNHLYGGTGGNTLRGRLNKDNDAPIDITKENWRNQIVFEYWPHPHLSRSARREIRDEKVSRYNPRYNEQSR